MTVALAEEICRRFDLDQVRFANSGTEATMDAIRIARAATGRDMVVKIEGSYHGHHDTVMFSVLPNADALGGRDLPSTTPMSSGIPADMAKHTAGGAVQRRGRVRGGAGRARRRDRLPHPRARDDEHRHRRARARLPAGAKDLCERHGVVLIFDEVKSGATVAEGGAGQRYGVRPHLACFAKALFGGTPGAAFGGDAAIMDVIGHGAAQMGTFNGNPLVAAAGLACLTEVLTPDAYAQLAEMGARLAGGCQAAIDASGIPAHTVDLGAKGCVSFRKERSRNYRDFLATKPELFGAAFPWAINRGVFMTPGDEEQWTLSVQHTDADIDRYVERLQAFCESLVG